MATYTDIFSGNSAYKLVLEVSTDSQSESDNSSVVDWKLYTIKSSGTGYQGTNTGSGSCSVNGSVWSDGSFSYNFTGSTPKTVVHAQGSKTINHLSDGTRTINVSASVSLGIIGSASISDTYTLPRIKQTPSAPGKPTVSNIGATSAKISWSAPSNNGGASVTSYQVQRALNSGFSSGVSTTTMSSGGTLSGLPQRDTVYVRVRAINSVGAGDWSATTSFTTLGHPTAPTGLTATPSTNRTGRIALSWTVPSSSGTGGITGYTIYRDGAKVATTTGTGTTWTDTGRTPYTSYTYEVSGRNSYSDDVGGQGPQSNEASAIAPGPPTAPQNLVGVSDGSVVGRVNLSWTAPVSAGAGGITGYTIRYADNTFIASTTGTGTTYSVNGLVPGTTYTFKVSARNALADAEGSESAYSNQVVVTPVGEPAAPTGVTVTPSSTVPGRLVLSWTPPAGTLSGYSIFSVVSGADTLIARINGNHTSYTIDNLTPGVTYSYRLRARTGYTDTLEDGYPGNWGGVASAVASGTPSANADQATPSVSALTSTTSAVFNGTYTITAVTGNTLRYTKVNPNIAFSASAGTIVNNTNPIFNGTRVITGTPTTYSITFARTASNVAEIGATGTVVNNSNVELNGSYVVFGVNPGAQLFQFTKSGPDFASRTVPVHDAPGNTNLVTNLSNAAFNGNGLVITETTSNTISYAKISANVAEASAAGTVVNVTNRDVFNGVYQIATIPAFNIVTYARTGTDVPLRTWFEPNGTIYRTVSPARMDVRFRSGWAG